MSDPIAQAAESMNAASVSAEPTPPAPVIAELPVTGNVLVNSTPTVDTPIIETKQYPDGSSATGVAPLPDVSPVDQASGELPRESHLLLLEAKIAGFRAKLVNAERVALDEFESIVGHVRAVL